MDDELALAASGAAPLRSFEAASGRLDASRPLGRSSMTARTGVTLRLLGPLIEVVCLIVLLKVSRPGAAGPRGFRSSTRSMRGWRWGSRLVVVGLTLVPTRPATAARPRLKGPSMSIQGEETGRDERLLDEAFSGSSGRHLHSKDGPRTYRYYDFIMAAFVTILICSNLISAQKRVASTSAGSQFIFGAGVLFFPISYLFGDILTEVYGYARSRKVVWAGSGRSSSPRS